MAKEEFNFNDKIKELAMDVSNCVACGKKIGCDCGVAYDEELYLKITDVFNLSEEFIKRLRYGCGNNETFNEVIDKLSGFETKEKTSGKVSK